MAIHVALNHKTYYRYDRPVTLGPHVIRLRPAVHSRVPVLSYSLKVEPEKHFINWQQDPQGNFLARLVFPEPTDRLFVEVDLIAEMAVFNPFDFFLEPAADHFPFSYEPELARDLKPSLEAVVMGPKLAAFLGEVPRHDARTIDFLVALNQQMHKSVGYVIRMEPGVQTCEETLGLETGSCRDSAWLMVQVLRHLGLAARFVSGYLIQLTPDIKALDGPSGPAADFTDLHAWAEVYLPGAGWVGLDPTSGMFAGEGHIPLACTADPGAAAPISGDLDPCETDFRYEMTLTRIVETPRVTRPYTEEQWCSILSLGDKVEADLAREDVRLTMGGEPTFVSIDDPDGPEWHHLALGPKKRELAVTLFSKMRDHFASGALPHFGQGKWYPGELLPRWALGCYWRKDGVPVWRDESLIAEDGRDYAFTTRHAKVFLEALTRRLEVDSRYIMPGHEDVFYYLWRERKLPENVDPLDSKLEDPTERAQMARVFEQGIGEAIGYVLPLRRMMFETGREWTSQPWFVRPKHLFLIPGDSPMGYRLPLDSLPWTRAADVEWKFEPDPFREREALPLPEQMHRMDLFEFGEPAQPFAERSPDNPARPQRGHSSSWVSRPALCVESRQGKLHIFMPPVENSADYLDLVAAIE
ncbi:MAG TPA: transglutaminase family protein, partial [Bryobacteraceae bacterium]|nr:transglutaminase family protein [Bryobacteraceae bacterium]